MLRQLDRYPHHVVKALRLKVILLHAVGEDECQAGKPVSLRCPQRLKRRTSHPISELLTLDANLNLFDTCSVLEKGLLDSIESILRSLTKRIEIFVDFRVTKFAKPIDNTKSADDTPRNS